MSRPRPWLCLALGLPTLLACGGSPPVEREPMNEEPPPVVPPPAPATEGPPVAAVRPVTNTYHGVDVVDPYQWLENPDDPEVRAWSDGQNQYARRVLAHLPGLEKIQSRVREVLGAATRR